MCRTVVSVSAALMAFAIATISAAADDRETCSELGDEAIAACGRLISRNPGDAASYANRGSAYRRKHDYDHAIADYDQAIQLDPKFAYAYTGRGSAYLVQRFRNSNHIRQPDGVCMSKYERPVPD
jgi:tetratricopeptide (TPR) repeat protein